MSFATGRIVQFLRHMAALQLLGMGRLEALHEGPCEAGIRQRRGCRDRVTAPHPATGVAPSFGRHCSALCGGAPKRCTRGPVKRGSGSVGDVTPALPSSFVAPASRYGVAPSFERHCSALRGRAIPHRCALPCTPKTAHSTPSNYRI